MGDAQQGTGPSKGLRLAVCMPALNEEQTIEQVIAAVPRSLAGVASVDVLVVDDGSSDRTADLARRAGATVVHHPRTLGVGAAFQTALAWAIERSYDLIVSIDSDGQFDPGHIGELIAPAVEGRADFVSASRFIDPALTPPMPWLKRWGNRRMSRLISRLTGQTFYDVSCGMRCYTRKAALHLNLMGSFTYTQEVFLNLAFKQLRIVEVPIPVRGQREHGHSRVASNLWRYAGQSLRIIFRCYRDYRPMRFFGRLAAALAGPGFLLEGFLLVHYLRTQGFEPHLWAGFLGGGLIALATLSFSLGMIGDMLARHRIYLEELLYERRRQAGRRPNSPEGTTDEHR